MSDLLLSRSGHVQIAEINRPPHNYFDRKLLALIADALGVADADKDIRVTLLCASGKSFCAGANFTGRQPETLEERRADSRQLYDQGLRIFRCKKPIVAAVQGHAIGGGLGVALAADFRVATPETSFSANFTRLGFHPGFGLTVTLPELVGTTRASLLMLTGRRVEGEEAYRIGMCDVLAPSESLREEAMKLAPAGSDENAFFRMVTSYWDMVASYVTAGVLNANLFYESNRELLVVWVRIKPLLPAIREAFSDPFYLHSLEEVGEDYAAWLNNRAPGSFEAFAKRIG
ncbi:MAG: enoyl-CoA hydratase/isomerase family protein [Dechloromonas sp.]|nr:MAG: enoyl-CoA hydratase/isomerase family protein [Dechloromonas sp.]